ncbi:MAG: DNA lyase [Ignavibacteriales bacterium]|nr:DNA lyase [Ignavibacteriales bacterium]
MKTSRREQREKERSSLMHLHQERRGAIRQRLRDFKEVPRSEYFYELLYCLMTPQTSAESADKVVAKLKEVSFATNAVDPEPVLRDRHHYIRFHKTKTERLLLVKKEFPVIASALAAMVSPVELREWLVKNVKGLGYKEATHFLRNIGRNGGLTILDRHILRNLQRYGAIRTVPKSMTKKRYLSVERRFIKFSETVGVPVDELDLLFWSMETGEIRK